jgi:hypothetical protein
MIVDAHMLAVVYAGTKSFSRGRHAWRVFIDAMSGTEWCVVRSVVTLLTQPSRCSG